MWWFSWCSGLTDVIIGEGITEIMGSTFSNCSALVNVTMSDSVKKIKGKAFYKCESLTEITLHKGLYEIGSNAFYGCSSLKNVYYTGTKNDWAMIYKHYGNDALLQAEITFSPAETPPEETIPDNTEHEHVFGEWEIVEETGQEGVLAERSCATCGHTEQKLLEEQDPSPTEPQPTDPEANEPQPTETEPKATETEPEQVPSNPRRRKRSPPGKIQKLRILPNRISRYRKSRKTLHGRLLPSAQ